MDPQKTTVKKISSGVWAFEQEIVRCFLIVGQARAMLLDTGAEPCDLLKSIRSITQLPLVVLHTHGDGDHTANDDLFPDIHAHPAEFETISGATSTPLQGFPPLIWGSVCFRSSRLRAIPPAASACWTTKTGSCSPEIPCPMGRCSSPGTIGISTPTVRP